MAVLGAGMHPWGKWGRSFVEYGTKAARAALADAGLDWRAVQSVVGADTVRGGYPGYVAGATFAKALGWQGARVTSVYAACASGAQAINTARAQILSGMADVALVVGADAAPKGFFTPAGGERPDDPDWLRFRVLGATNPAYFGLYARRRMALYGDTADDFARVKVKNSAAGAANPYARYRKAVTAQEVAASAVVADPLRLLDICATSDGAAALVLTSMEFARRHGATDPVRSARSPLPPRTIRGPYWICRTSPPTPLPPYRSRRPASGRRSRAPPTRRPGSAPKTSRWPRSTTSPPPWSWSGTRIWGCVAPVRAPSCCGTARRRWAGICRSIPAAVWLPSARRCRPRPSPRSAN